MQIIKEILKIALLSILIILLVVILNINLTLINNNIADVFMSIYWLFYILIIYFFIYVFIYLVLIFYLFKKRIIPFNYIFVLLFTIVFYVGAEFFTARNERIDSIIKSVMIVLSCSGIIYYWFKKWINFNI